MALMTGSTVIGAPAEGFERAPYVQLATPDSIRLVWRTDRGMNPVVKFGESVDALDRVVPAADVMVRRQEGKQADEGVASGPPLFVGKPIQSAGEDVRQYEVILRGLAADRNYFYAIFDGERRMTPDIYTIVTPLLVGDRIGLHPVAVIFAVLAGGQLFGFTGVLLALPVAAVIMVLLRHVHDLYKLSDLYAEPPVDPPRQS